MDQQPGVSEREQMSSLRLVVLHLVPGLLATLLFVLIAPTLQDAGFPAVFAFFVAVLVVIVPWELGFVVRSGRKAGGGWLSGVPFRESLTRRDWLLLFPGLVVAALIGFLLFALLEPTIIESVFGWLPSWFVELVPVDDAADYASEAWAITLVVYAVMNVVVGPWVEELYFRGYLLPRMSRMGKWAPLVNSTLFSIYHFWSPWSLLSRIAGVTPFVYAVWFKRNIYLGMAVHMLLNGISTALVTAAVLGELA